MKPRRFKEKDFIQKKEKLKKPKFLSKQRAKWKENRAKNYDILINDSEGNRRKVLLAILTLLLPMLVYLLKEALYSLFLIKIY